MPTPGAQLRGLRYSPPEEAADQFPFGIPAISTLSSLAFDTPVTCFVGENGSGKSTLLEAIAIAAQLPAVGAMHDIARDQTLARQARLAHALTLIWRERRHRGLFLRSEDFFGFQNALKRDRLEMLRELERIEAEYVDRSLEAKKLAMGPFNASIADMDGRYGKDPDARSHGEAFLHFFSERLVPRGLYLLDEPEAALSPQRQLSLLAMMFDLVADGAQFVLATHSPILLAFPGARIFSFDDGPIAQVEWSDTEHVRLTRDFLQNPERYLRNLRG